MNPSTDLPASDRTARLARVWKVLSQLADESEQEREKVPGTKSEREHREKGQA